MNWIGLLSSTTFSTTGLSTRTVSRFEWQTIDLNTYPNVKRWYVAIASRPAVERGYAVPMTVGGVPMP